MNGGVIHFPKLKFLFLGRNVADAIESLRYTSGEARSVQEMKRIILRSIAYQHLTKTYFGKGHFHWREPYQVYQKCLELLKDYPKPRYLSNFQVRQYVSLFGEVRAITPEDRLEELKAKANNSLEILEAKREAILCFISENVEGLVAGRPPNYRESYNPDVPQSPELPRTVRKKVFQGFVRPVLNILKSHLVHCKSYVRSALEEYVLKPELPFDIELPD